MRSTRQMSITLPLEMATMVERKVATGEYASDSEVIRDGLRVLIARDRALERWLKDVVVPAHDRIVSGEERTLTASEVREQLRSRSAAIA